ncbi:MAG: cell division protein ZipA, partial [Halothiobacillaceae bacterium]
IDEGLDEPSVALRAEPVMPSRIYEAPKPAVTAAPFTPTPKAAPPVRPASAFYDTQELVDESLDDEPIVAHSVAAAEPASHPEDGLVLVLNVVVGSGRQLRGSQILKALTATGLTYGAMNVFHYLSPHSPGKPLFSVANMVEPGCFNLSSMEELATPGLTLFANVARPEEGITTFNAMLDVAKKLADYLDATVCDERRGTLSKQRIEHIHGQIREHQRRARLTQLSHA